jgi:hypothetical protein
MFSHLRVVALATIGLVTMAVVHSWANAPVAIHGEARMTAPVQLQAAQVRSLAGASMRSISGF